MALIKGDEVKAILGQYREVKWMIEDLKRQIDEADYRMVLIKGGNITGMPRGSQPTTLADLIADKEDLISRKLRFEKIAKQKKEIVQTYIDTVLSINHNHFLTFYYINGMSVEEIASHEHYTVRHGFRIFREAVKMVDLSLNL